MWNFPRYTSRKRVFCFFRGTSEITEAGAGARTSRMAIKIRCKSFLEYLEILIAAVRVSAKGDFVFEGQAGWSDNLSPNSGGGEESRRAIEGATEGRSCWRRPRPWTEVILELFCFKNLKHSSKGWLTRWV